MVNINIFFAQGGLPIDLPDGSLNVSGYSLFCDEQKDSAGDETNITWQNLEDNMMLIAYNVHGVVTLVQFAGAFKFEVVDEENEFKRVTFEKDALRGEQVLINEDDCWFCPEANITHNVDKIVLNYRWTRKPEQVVIYEGGCSKTFNLEWE